MHTTVKEFAKQNEVHYGVAMGMILFLLKAGMAKAVGTLPSPDKKRGKRAIVYEVANEATLNFKAADVTGWVEKKAKEIEAAKPGEVPVILQTAAVTATEIPATAEATNPEPATVETPAVETTNLPVEKTEEEIMADLNAMEQEAAAQA